MRWPRWRWARCLPAGMSAKRAPGRKLFWALGAGLVVFLVLLAAGLLLRAQPIDLVRTAASLLCALAAFGARRICRRQYAQKKTVQPHEK